MIKKLPFSVIFLISFFLLSYSKNDTELLQAKEFVVVLDAGHGGHDPGNLGNGYLEKTIALNIVLQVGNELETNGVKVVYTRQDDTFVDLFKRGEIANKANADLFVSVHCDSHNSDAHGAGTFVLGLHANEQNFEVAKKENSVIYLEDDYEDRYAEYDINSPESIIGLTIMQEEFLDQSIQLAKFMQDNFTQSLSRKNRKVKQAGFIVLHQTFMPSVLVETGFLTNKDEGAYLNSKKGQEEMGKAIAKAIMKYKEGVSSESVADRVSDVAEAVPRVEKPSEVKENPKPVVQEVVKEESKTVPKKEPVQESKTAGVKEMPKIIEKPDPIVAKNENLSVAEPLVNNDEIVFKVQLMASTKKIPLNIDNFNGLDNLSTEPFKGFTRYMYGHTTSFSEAEIFKAQAVAKGYKSAYIVAYKGGTRIKLAEALRLVKGQ